MGLRQLMLGLAMLVTLVIGLGPVTLAWADLLQAPPDDMGHNGLSSASLFDNSLTTNRNALLILQVNPLNNTTFTNNQYLKRQLLDPPARDVLADIVACALSRSSYVEGFRGELGLCSKSDQDGWSGHQPSDRCLQLVTACLLARVNALHRRVPVSFHGTGSVLADTLPMRTKVKVEVMYRESPETAGLSEGTQIEGFLTGGRCPNGHDCNWSPQYVGTCAPNSKVMIAFSIQGFVPPGVKLSPCESMPVRVCKGIYGCKENDSSVVPRSALEYSGFVAKQFGAVQPRTCKAEFDCPQQGSYGVMTKIPNSLITPYVPPEDSSDGHISVSSSNAYPTPETGVFAYREGAFFGNLFDPNGVRRLREVTIGRDGQPIIPSSNNFHPPGVPGQAACRSVAVSIPYDHVYACYSLGSPNDESVIYLYNGSKNTQLSDSDGVANLNDRVCADPNLNPGCFPSQPQACNKSCKWDNSKLAYTDCSAPGTARAPGTIYAPITTYLDDPCSLVDPLQCAVLSAHRAEARPAPITVTPVP